MAKKYISDFTGGLNDVTRPDLLADNEVQQCINYEISGTGVLVKRKDTEVFDAHLDETLEDLFGISDGGSLLSISPPYYPALTLKEQANDFMLFVFGNNSSSNKVLYALYQKVVEDESSNPWTHEFINLSGEPVDLLNAYKSVKRTFAEDFLNFDVGSEKANFTNGTDPNGFFYVDNKQEAVSGTLGYDPPLNVPIIKSLRDDSSNQNTPVFSLNNFTRDDSVEAISSPGYIQVVYSYVTKDGFESNPSPVSATADYAYFYRDDDRVNTQRLNEFEISNLSIPPTMSPEYVDRVQYFNIYVRVFKSLKADASKNFEFCQQVSVISKTRWGSNTNNTYVLDRALSPGDIATYENDAAPRSKFVSTTGGVTFLGNTQNALGFPAADFQYKSPINIYNSNSKTYIDAPIQIRVWGGDSSPQDNGDGSVPEKIENLKWVSFFTFNQSDNVSDIRTDGTMSDFAREHIRLYHQDMTTPLKVVYKRSTLTVANKKFVDLMVKIPQLPPGSTTVYLAFNDIEGGDPGNAGVLYPKKIDTLTEVQDILQYFTSDNENYTFFQSMEQNLINDNVDDQQLEELQRILYSHPYLTTLNSELPAIEDIDPLYKHGMWVCGWQSCNASTPAMQDMTVKEHTWGDSTLVSCSTNQWQTDINTVDDKQELGFVNQAYMNYGGYVRADNHSDYSGFAEVGPYGSDLVSFSENALERLQLHKQTNRGRVIARDYGEDSFWSTFENYTNNPGGARPNSRATTSCVGFEGGLPGNSFRGNVAFGGVGFNNEDLANVETEFTVFFHMHIPEGQSFVGDISSNSEYNWRTYIQKADLPDGYDWWGGGYYTNTYSAGGPFGKRWERWWRNLFGIRAARRTEDVADSGDLEDNSTVVPRFQFGITKGKAQRGQSESISKYHPFLSTYNTTQSADVYSAQYAPATTENSERRAYTALAAEDTADWLDEYPTLWCLFLGQAGDPTWRIEDWANYIALDDENSWTPFINDMRWNSFICYTGNSNDMHGPITGGQPMDKKVMPPSWDRPGDYFIALSFKDGIDGIEKAKTSLFVCNTGGTEPFEEDAYNILDDDGKIYCPTDAKQVSDIEGKDLSAESFLRNIVGKDGFNFGANPWLCSGTDVHKGSNRDSSSANMRLKMQYTGNTMANLHPNGLTFSELHIEYGDYFNGNSPEHKTAFNYAAFGFHFMKEGIGWVPPRRPEGISSIHNKNITYGDTFEEESVLNNRTIRWSDMGGAHYPDLNYKFVKEPIEALMPAPGFLADEYQNCMLVFTRNMIYRFVLVGAEDGTWAAQTDNLIEEYNQYGLFAPKSLVKAGNALFWLSESGVVMFNAKGLRLVDKNKVKVKINKDAVGFYNPISNQYVLTNV